MDTMKKQAWTMSTSASETFKETLSSGGSTLKIKQDTLGVGVQLFRNEVLHPQASARRKCIGSALHFYRKNIGNCCRFFVGIALETCRFHVGPISSNVGQMSDKVGLFSGISRLYRGYNTVFYRYSDGNGTLFYDLPAGCHSMTWPLLIMVSPQVVI